MSIKIETPPVLSGASEAQLKQVYGYLYRLSESLNVALSDLSSGGADTGYQLRNGRSINDGGNDGIIFDKELGDSYKALRSLIINTAQIIRSEMDVIEYNLNQSYEAISRDYGTFAENFEKNVIETAKETISTYGYDSQLSTLKEQAAGFSDYIIHTEGFIKEGFIDEDELGVPILGIAIGQGLTSVKVTKDGKEYEKFDGAQNCAFYTANKLSFRVNGQEVAYMSNSKLHIKDMDVSGKVTLGPWELTTNNGFTIKWIGGVS